MFSTGADLILDFVPMLRPLVANQDLGSYAYAYDEYYEDGNAKLSSYYKKIPNPCLLSKRTGAIDRQAVLSPSGLFALPMF